MRVRLQTGLILLTAYILMVMAMPINAIEAEDKTLYIKRLKYEFDNRTFAYLSMQKAMPQALPHILLPLVRSH